MSSDARSATSSQCGSATDLSAGGSRSSVGSVPGSAATEPRKRRQ